MKNIKSALCAAWLIALPEASAQTISETQHGPQIEYPVSGDYKMFKKIDSKWLGPNGELTVGFIKSISPSQCGHLTYKNESANEEEIEKTKTHFTEGAHRHKSFTRDTIEKAYQRALKMWQEQQAKPKATDSTPTTPAPQ
jgi:hypothetical protein